MKRLWAIVMVVALTSAPCAVAHAASADLFSAGSTAHPHADGAAHDHSHGPASHARHDRNALPTSNHNHDHGDHDCLMNCLAWSSASSSIVLQRILTPDDTADQFPVLFVVLTSAVPDLAGFGDDGPPPDFDAGITPQISILHQTARRRI